MVCLINVTGSADTSKEQAASNSRANPCWELRLYIAGQTPKSLAALANLQRICNERLPGKHQLQIIDLLERPAMASLEQIVAIPTLLRSRPLPRKKIAGDLSNTKEVLLSLEIPSQSDRVERLTLLCDKTKAPAKSWPCRAQKSPIACCWSR